MPSWMRFSPQSSAGQHGEERFMSLDGRARLGQMQAALMGALAGAATPPAGFDPIRLQAAARSLAAKRRRAVARAWPNLTAALGDRFGERFAAFAAQTPLPRWGGALADGRAFARWLLARQELPEAARLELLAVDLRYRARADGLVPRRGPSLQIALLRQPRRLVVALRWPGLREYWRTLRVGMRTLRRLP